MYLKLKKLLVFVLFCFSFFLITQSVFAKTIDEEIADITKQITELENSIAPLKKESTGLQSKLTSAKNQITVISNQVDSLSQKLVEKESDLEIQKLLLAERVKRYYKNSKSYNSFLILFSASDNKNGSVFQQYAWYQSIISQDKNTITQYTTDITVLTDNKNKLEAEKTKLAQVKKDLESRSSFLATEIKKAETYKNKLNQDLLNLEAKRIA